VLTIRNAHSNVSVIIVQINYLNQQHLNNQFKIQSLWGVIVVNKSNYFPYFFLVVQKGIVSVKRGNLSVHLSVNVQMIVKIVNLHLCHLI
jgi:hypothetical protein